MASVTYRFKPRAKTRIIIPGDTISAQFWEKLLSSSHTGALEEVATRLSELRYPKLTPAEALAGAAKELQAEIGYIPSSWDVLNYVRGLNAPPF